MSTAGRTDPAADDPTCPYGSSLLRVEEVAALVGITPRSVWRYVSAGKLHPEKHLGRQTRFPATEAVEFARAYREALGKPSPVCRACQPDTPVSKQ